MKNLSDDELFVLWDILKLAKEEEEDDPDEYPEENLRFNKAFDELFSKVQEELKDRGINPYDYKIRD